MAERGWSAAFLYREARMSRRSGREGSAGWLWGLVPEERELLERSRKQVAGHLVGGPPLEQRQAEERAVSRAFLLEKMKPSESRSCWEFFRPVRNLEKEGMLVGKWY